MIVIRRLIAVWLILTLIVVLLLTLLIGRLVDTLFEPEFYIRHLDEGKVYELIHDQAVPAALDEFVQR